MYNAVRCAEAGRAAQRVGLRGSLRARQGEPQGAHPSAGLSANLSEVLERSARADEGVELPQGDWIEALELTTTGRGDEGPGGGELLPGRSLVGLLPSGELRARWRRPLPHPRERGRGARDAISGGQGGRAHCPRGSHEVRRARRWLTRWLLSGVGRARRWCALWAGLLAALLS